MKRWKECSKKQKIERWENCLRVLQGLSPHERRRHWNMGFWGDRNACGTVACAAGHCGMDPWFRRRGLTLDFVLDPSGDWVEKWCGEEVGFFGYLGCSEVFFNTEPRPVGKVIKEVKQHIKLLRSLRPEKINDMTASHSEDFEYE